MAKKPAPPLVINVSRDKIFFCTHATSAPAVFPLTPAMISDLEVKDKNELTAKLQEFILKSQLKPAPLVIILAEMVYFEKNYIGNVPPTPEETQKFIDTVPFPTVSAKLFHIPAGYKLAVINRDLYETIEQVFEQLNFRIHSVIPNFVLGAINAPKEFSAQSCRVIYKKLDYLAENSFTTPPEQITELHQKEQVFVNRYKIPLVIFSLAFMVLFGVMVYLLLVVPATKPKSRARPSAMITPAAVKPTTRPSPTVTPAPLATPSAQLLSQTTVQVLNGSGIAGQAAAVEARLREAGFTSLVTGNSPRVNTGVTQMVFSKELPQNVRQWISGVVQSLYPDATTREGTDTQYDAIITTGRVTP